MSRRLRSRRRTSAPTLGMERPSGSAVIDPPGRTDQRPRPWRAGTPVNVSLLTDLGGVVVLPLLLAGVVRLPVDRLERRLDLVEAREVREVILGEPVRHLVDVVRAEEALAQLAPGAVIDRPGVRELDGRV